MKSLAEIQWPTWAEWWNGTRTIGFLEGVVCALFLVFVLWLIAVIRRQKAAKSLIKVIQPDGSELAYTPKSLKSFVRLIFQREFPHLILREMGLSHGRQRKILLNIEVAEGENVSECQSALIQRLHDAFDKKLGIQQAISDISVKIIRFIPADAPVQDAPVQDAPVQDADVHETSTSEGDAQQF